MGRPETKTMAARPPAHVPAVRTQAVDVGDNVYVPLEGALAAPHGTVVSVVALAAEVPHPVPSKGSGECVGWALCVWEGARGRKGAAE